MLTLRAASGDRDTAGAPAAHNNRALARPPTVQLLSRSPTSGFTFALSANGGKCAQGRWSAAGTGTSGVAVNGSAVSSVGASDESVLCVISAADGCSRSVLHFRIGDRGGRLDVFSHGTNQRRSPAGGST